MPRKKTRSKKTNFTSKGFLLVCAMVIFLFNFSFKVNTSAVEPDQTINLENLLQKHNLERARNNVEPLTINQRLNKSAEMKGQVMIDNDCWSHYCPNGRSPWEFFKDAGYDFVFAGENLAEGFVNLNNLMEAWMNSKTHRDNLLNASFNEVGFGIIKGSFQSNPSNTIVVVHFGNSGRPKIDQTSELQVYYPEEGAIVSGNEFEVKGSVQNADGIEIYINDQKKSEGTILNGEFTSKVQNIQEGEYSLQARGVDFNGNPLTSQTVNFTVEVDKNPNTMGLTFLQGVLPEIDPNAKNTVNLIFVLVIALIFLIDFIAISRTKILSKDKSFSHFHFAVFIILASIIIIGGFGGQIAEGLGIS